MSGIIVALIGICGTILGTLIGGISTHLLHYKNRKSEETKIINESIHYLLEVFFLVNRLNFEKMIDAYVDYYLQEIRKIFPKMDDDSIESIKKQFYPQLKNTIVPLSQKYSLLTEDEKRDINTLIGSVLEQIKKDAAKTTVS